MSAVNGQNILSIFNHPPQRVVSLVPSMTESLFDLGFGRSVIGVTDYCVYPAEATSKLPHLGGPKNPRLDEIIRLKPDLVLANQEENTRQTVEALEKAGIQVWLTFPQTVRQAMDVLWEMANLFKSRAAALRLEVLDRTLDWVEASLEGKPPVTYFCPIWQDVASSGQPWWMTFNRHTYASDILRLVGGQNAFADRERRYPLSADLGLEAQPSDADQPQGERDTRYPRLPLEELRQADPQLILLPSEPFAYDESHRQAIINLLPEVNAVKNGRVRLVDGSLITWHGTRIARALEELPALLEDDHEEV